MFLFPSLHDEAPWSVAEALSCGLPVACVDRGGPPVVAGAAGVAVESRDVSTTARELGQALSSRAFPDHDAALARAETFMRDVHLAQLIEILVESRDEKISSTFRRAAAC